MTVLGVCVAAAAAAAVQRDVPAFLFPMLARKDARDTHAHVRRPSGVVMLASAPRSKFKPMHLEHCNAQPTSSRGVLHQTGWCFTYVPPGLSLTPISEKYKKCDVMSTNAPRLLAKVADVAVVLVLLCVLLSLFTSGQYTPPQVQISAMQTIAFSEPFETQNMGDFLENGLLEPAAAALVRREVQSLCSELRPEAISLTDAWQFTDKYLGSALGRKDGCESNMILFKYFAKAIPLRYCVVTYVLYSLSSRNSPCKTFVVWVDSEFLPGPLARVLYIVVFFFYPLWPSSMFV